MIIAIITISYTVKQSWKGRLGKAERERQWERHRRKERY
jgi:hypothetical protein